MKTIELKGEIRKELGKKATKKLRREEQIPCIMYGVGEPIHFTTHAKDFNHLVYTPHAYLVNIDVEGSVHQAVIQDIQFHPVSDEVLHADFLEVAPEKPVSVNIPVHLSGFAKGVQQGGKLVLEMRKLHVKGLIKDIPDHLSVDVTSLEVGQTLKVRELSFEGIEIQNPRNAVVAAIKTTRAAKSASAASGEGESVKKS